jgi:hypothetical protein
VLCYAVYTWLILDCVTMFSDKTHKWHKARIVDVIREPPVRFKVHFNGWKPKHDEWLDAGSPRLAALGQYTEIVMVDVVKPPLIPWYENTVIHELVSCVFRSVLFFSS